MAQPCKSLAKLRMQQEASVPFILGLTAFLQHPIPPPRTCLEPPVAIPSSSACLGGYAGRKSVQPAWLHQLMSLYHSQGCWPHAHTQVFDANFITSSTMHYITEVVALWMIPASSFKGNLMIDWFGNCIYLGCCTVSVAQKWSFWSVLDIRIAVSTLTRGACSAVEAVDVANARGQEFRPNPSAKWDSPGWVFLAFPVLPSLPESSLLVSIVRGYLPPSGKSVTQVTWLLFSSRCWMGGNAIAWAFVGA